MPSQAFPAVGGILPSSMVGHRPPQRRMGRFWLHQRLIENSPADALAALDGCIIVRAEAHYATGRIEYDAIHPDFEPLSEGQPLPLYRPVISGGKRLRWEREVTA